MQCEGSGEMVEKFVMILLKERKYAYIMAL